MPLPKLTTLLIVFSLSFHMCQAQLSQIDSLNQELLQVSKISDSLIILDQLSTRYVDANVEKGFLITNSTLELLKRYPNDSLEIRLLLRKANYHTLSSNFVQSEKILLTLLSSDQDASLRSQIFQQLGKNLQLSGKHDSAIFYFDKALSLRSEIEDHIGVQMSRAYKSESLNRTGNLQEALELCTQSLVEIQEIQAKKEEAIILNFLGGINTSLGAMPAATKYYLEALTIADSLENRRLKMEQLNDMGVIYAVQGESEESINFFERALMAAEKIRSHRDYIGALSNLAYMHSVTNDTEQSIVYYEEALAYNDQYGDQCLHPFIYDGMARLYERLTQPDSVKKYFELVLAEARNCQLKEFEISALQGIGRYYEGKGYVKQSIHHFQTSFGIAEENSFKPLLKISADQLYQVYKQLGDFEEALKYHEIAEAIEDSIYNEQNKDEILRQTARYEFENEKHRIEDEQEKQQILHEAEMQSQLLTRNYMLVGLMLTLILILTLWMSYESKKKSNRVLARLNHEKNELIGVVAHDLRSPLNLILGFSQMMIEDQQDTSSNEQQFLLRINNSAGRMKHMIERVLDVNAIESEMIKLDAQVVDLGAMINAVIESLKPSADVKDITIESHFSEQTFFAEIDENYGIQVFENLISNAIKFSEKNKPVDIEILSEGDRVKMLVRDHGPGINSAELKLLFERFTKLSARPTANESSTGLGLSIVKKYVSAMGGEVDVRSEVGEGTTFIVSFWNAAYLKK